jgi:Domain of unknown function (DUF5916)
MLLFASLFPLLQSVTPAASAPVEGPRSVYNGRQSQLEVRAPRVADAGSSEVVIDGSISEAVWQRAVMLTGFSLHQPIDGRPSPDSTEVLLWYSPNAMYFAIRAFEPHGGGSAVRATLADRDRVSADDNVEIHLDTFGNRRRAFVFIVNPLGIQGDGTKSEGGGFMPGSNIMPGQNDLSPDFLWQSKGRVTEWGYEVELRVPFSALRYPGGDSQDWGLQIVRNVQHSGYQETWTPARRASASFLSQAGSLRQLRGLQYRQAVELNPELTSTTSGLPSTPGGSSDWRYRSANALGGNIRWGMTSNFTLNGTVKPDFSQVEADATQIATDLRFALFYPEKRPFFVEGIDQFNVPNSLVYTRRVVRPTAAAKITGKVGATDFALLSAVDDQQISRAPGENPVVNILRLRRDFSGQSTIGLLLSGREEAGSFNRVAGGDLRVVFGGMYFAQFQAVGSATRNLTTGATATRAAPMWEAVVDRTGRAFGFHYSIRGIHRDFDAWNGFVPRSDLVEPSISNRFTWYGRPGSAIEQYNTFFTTAALWRYDDFFATKSLLEDRIAMMNGLTFRGRWTVNVNPTLATFAFDPNRYANRFVISAGGIDTSAFVPSARTTTLVLTARVSTPQFQRFDASVSVTGGNDVDFQETSRVRRFDVNASANWRPTEKLRVNGSYASTLLTRRSDEDPTTRIRIPRIKLEYQIARPIFVRFVGQYDAESGDPLVRDPRTGLPVYSRTGTSLSLLNRTVARDLRVDWLFSYRPTPGTVLFAGYGSSLTEDEPLAFRDLRRASDALFVKMSYLFRM